MTSHKERLDAINRKDFSLPRNYFRNSQNGLSNSHIPNNEKRLYNSQIEKQQSENDSVYQDPLSPEYLNLQSEKVKFAEYDIGISPESSDRQPLQSSQPRNGTSKNNTNRSHASMYEPRIINSNQQLYKSQSLNALKSKEPSKTLLKSSIQQEYHDKKVQHRLKRISTGKSRKPCVIATIMFIIFGVLFILGLTLICLTYIYKNINFSLDKGEMIGPVFMACSFIFLGVGIKFLFDSHKIARKERKTVIYDGYDRRYVGPKNTRNGTLIANEKLVSGTATNIGLTRIPNRKQIPLTEDRTLGRSSVKTYGKLTDTSKI